jgi:hypothetical protein
MSFIYGMGATIKNVDLDHLLYILCQNKREHKK